jgi:hypothetical protein
MVNILSKVKSVSPSYDLMSNALINKYGYYTGGICEGWVWQDNIKTATEEELYEMYIMIIEYDLEFYRNLYYKAQSKNLLEITSDLSAI